MTQKRHWRLLETANCCRLICYRRCLDWRCYRFDDRKCCAFAPSCRRSPWSSTPATPISTVRRIRHFRPAVANCRSSTSGRRRRSTFSATAAMTKTTTFCRRRKSATCCISLDHLPTTRRNRRDRDVLLHYRTTVSTTSNGCLSRTTRTARRCRDRCCCRSGREEPVGCS